MRIIDWSHFLQNMTLINSSGNDKNDLVLITPWKLEAIFRKEPDVLRIGQKIRNDEVEIDCCHILGEVAEASRVK